MANNLGDFDTGITVYLKFSTARADTGAPATLTSGAVSVYKDNSTTQSTSGVTFSGDFDSVTGLNHVTIDLSSDGTFYSAGSFFDVVITTGTVNSVSAVGFCVGQFTIRKTADLKPTTAARTLDVSAGGEAGLDWANIGSPTTTVNLSGTSTKALEPTVAARTLDVTATGEAGIDWANIGAPTTTVNLSGTSTKAVEPTVAGRTLDVSAGGEAGLDWANIGSPTTAQNLSSTTIATTQKVDVDTIKTNPVANAGTVTFPTNATLASTTNITAGTLTTVTTATNLTTNNDKTGYALSSAGVQAIWDKLTSALTTVGSIGKLLVDNIDAAISSRSTYSGGAVASVTGNVGGNVVGSVGSVTGNVGGNVTGSVGSVAAGGITATSIATDAIDADALAADAVNEIADGLLNRDMSTGTDSGSSTVRTVRQALRALRNKWTIATGTYTVFKEDDSTSSWTSSLSTATADPVTGSDPAGP